MLTALGIVAVIGLVYFVIRNNRSKGPKSSGGGGDGRPRPLE